MKWSLSQQRAIETMDSNLVVSAGAGSGKTAVLVERVIHLLMSDPTLRMEQFLIMTFTEAAAAEMRQRIAKSLRQRLETAKQTGNMAMKVRYEQAIEGLWQAQISTIHSFCLEVVRRNLLALNLTTDFRMLDENERKILMLDEAEAVVEAMLHGEHASMISQMMTALRLADAKSLTQVLLRMYDLARSQVDPTLWLEQVAGAYAGGEATWQSTPFAKPFVSWIMQQMDVSEQYFVKAESISARIPELDKCTEWLQEAISRIREARAALSRPDIDVDAAAKALYFWVGGKSLAIRYKGPEADEIKVLRDEGNRGMKKLSPVIARGSEALLEDLNRLAPHISQLCDLVTELILRVRMRKEALCAIDFNDLEHFAFEILHDGNSGEVVRFRELYRHVFVDEYQDTSPIQDALVNLLTDNRGNLFAVGDVKQSIYRFRMAEPSLFLRRYEAYQREDGGKVIDLTENYRSRKEVVGFVNFVFGQLFRVETTGFNYDGHAQMNSGARYPEISSSSPFVEVHLFERNAADSDEDALDSTTAEADVSAVEREAQIVASRIQTMLEEATPVWDKDAERYRPVQLGDIAVLLRSGRDTLNTTLDVLRANGIDATANTSTGFYDALEVQWLIAALQTADNPLDDLAMLVLLRSPLVGFDESLLARIRLAHRRGSLWDAVSRVNRQTEVQDTVTGASLTEEDANLVRDFCDMLHDWRMIARSSGVTETLQRICKDTECLRYISGMTRGAARRANIDKLMGLARAYDERSGHAGIYGFLNQWRKEYEANLDLGAASVTKANAVQVMTIHRSKGLEYPVVFVIDLGKKFLLTQDVVYLNRTYGIGVVRYERATQQRWRTVSSIAVAHSERQESLAEEARILYVAFTRARERLILVGSTNGLLKKLIHAMYAHETDDRLLLAGAFMSASSVIDWLLPVLVRHPQAGALQQLIGNDVWDGRVFAADDADMSLHVHREADIVLMASRGHDKGVPECSLPQVLKVLRQHAPDTASLPSVRIVDEDDTGIQWLFGKVSATDMRRLHVALQQSGKQRRQVGAAASLLEDPMFVRENKLTPREEGIAFHAFMQRYQRPIEPTPEAVKAELCRLVERHELDAQLAEAVPIHHVVEFLTSELGERMQRAKSVYREQAFFHRIDVPIKPGETVPVVAQGVIDCLVEEEDQWLVIDYKTDRVTPADVDAKAREYEAQVATYLEALKPLAAKKPVRAYLYFVRIHEAVPVHHMNLADVFVSLLERAKTYR